MHQSDGIFEKTLKFLMGNSEWERQIQHFCHDHPLVLTNMEEVGHECSGCKSAATGWIYRCNYCNFDLHLSCSAIPLQIKHPVDPHPLCLLAQPVYKGGHFKCDACGMNSKGFSFHCSLCQTDLHPFCANLPLQFYHPSHPHVALSLIPPYPQKVFSCDVCHNPGTDSWHYHCSHCFFDVHVTCVNVSAQSNINPNLRQPITATRSFNVASSSIPSRGTGILQRSAGPYSPAMFNQMPVQGLPIPTGIPMGAASRFAINLPTMFPSASNTTNSSQNQVPFKSAICNGILQGAATTVGSIITKAVLGDIIGSGN